MIDVLLARREVQCLREMTVQERHYVDDETSFRACGMCG